MSEQLRCPKCQSNRIFVDGDDCLCRNCHFEFQRPQEEKPFQPMHLFLSYGHTEDTICRLINEALQERGHSTWFDQKDLHEGQDWRERIIKGIAESTGVISCLSRHSVRDPGVCRDELSIAVGVRGGNIKTILLEQERDVCPPASLCHIQWLDMSDWHDKYDQGPEVFQPWFDDEMAKLFKVIESEENKAFSGEITAIQEQLHINYDTSKQRDLLRRLFVGRKWLEGDLDKWLDDPQGARLCVLYGDPGVGKSAFAAHYTHYNPRVAASLFCEYDRPHYNDPRTVVMTLAYLLACRLSDYRKALTIVLDREDRLDELTESELFNLLLTNPLTDLSIDGGREALCIVIDGLDECAQGERNALAETLARYVPRLPAWLRVLITAREVAAVKTPLEGAFSLELHGDGPQNQEDIRAYFAHRLTPEYGGDPGLEKALDALAQHSGGIFLYASLVCKGILEGKLSLQDVDNFPDGLSGAFYQWFGWFFPDDKEYKAYFRLPLGVLLASPDPLPEEELKRIFQWDNNRLDDFVRRVEVLLRRDKNLFNKETLAFSHQYLSEWLDTPQAGPFRSDQAAAREKMAQRFYRLFQEDATALTEYESLHLASLLEQTGDAAALAEVSLSHDLFWNMIDAGNRCYRNSLWSKQSAALACYEQAQAMAEGMVAKRGNADDRYDLATSYERRSHALQSGSGRDEALTLGRKALEITQQLVQEQDTPKHRGGLCVCYDNVAHILWFKDDLDGALELYQKSLELRKQLAEELDTPKAHGNLSASYDDVAGILRRKGNLDGAMELYRKSLELRKQLARRLGTLGTLRGLNFSYDDVADILRRKDDVDGVLALYQGSLEFKKQLARELDTPEAHRDLSESYEEVAEILRDRGDLDGALELYQKTLEIMEQLAREFGTPEARRNLSVSYHKVADVLRDKGDLDGAQTLYQKALEIRARLADELGTSAARRDLSNSYWGVADILRAKGDLDGAMGLYQKSLEIKKQQVENWDSIDDFTPVDDLIDLASNYEKIAGILQDKGDLDGALALYWKALENWEELTLKPDPMELIGDFLGDAYKKTASLLQTMGDLDGALRVYQRDVKYAWRLAREWGTLTASWYLTTTYENVAHLLQAKGDSDGAAQLCQKELALARQRAQKLGAVSCYGKDADTMQDKGDLDGALALYRKALEIAEPLTRELDTPDARQGLCVSYEKVANFSQAKSGLDGAPELYQKALELRKQLARDLGTTASYDDLVSAYYNLSALSVFTISDRLSYTQEGLSLSEQLLQTTGQDKYQYFYDGFRQRIEELETESP